MTVLQIIPTLVTGGAERTTIDIAAALAARGDRALVASEGGRLVDELKSVGGEFVRMPVSWKNPVAMLANARRIAALIESEQRRHRACAKPRARPGRRLLACRRDRRAVRHDVSRHLWRNECAEAALQFRDGAGRGGHRQFALHRAS